MPENIVSASNIGLTLSSRAGPVEILRKVSFELAAGKSMAIVGPSGSGKTSLLMVLAGLEHPTTGNVRVAGHDLIAMDEDELALARGKDIGIVFQSFHLVPTMTALENVALPLEFQGVAAAFDKARSLLDEVGLSKRIDHFPAELSGGEQQRVAIARALSVEPRLILADEPTGNLDGKTGRNIIELLFGMREKRGATLILITHDMTLAEKCDRVLQMSDGRLVEQDEAAVS